MGRKEDNKADDANMVRERDLSRSLSSSSSSSRQFVLLSVGVANEGGKESR